ncbi:alpha/beta hydrolase [Mediterraneibacter faecis]|uniref:alpha/beta hydrolase n=1 Tax=Mediterraneibacter faecis TaxID=592978 RepID=UPI0022E1461E|nr:alpha/beta hydrolase family protein [Mediterraneibacter faecis]
MALLQVNFISKSLMRTVPIQVILPVDRITLPGMPEREEKTYKTLYLLHGVFGNYTDWVSGTSIQRWAEERNLAVVMPSGDNMFYVDQEEAHNYYGEFIGRELVEITRKMFPLSKKRDDTYIAGLSMGGYGALRNGLKYHDTFGYIAGLSSALITERIENRTDDVPFFIESRAYAQSIFGNLDIVKGSDKDLKWLAEKLKREETDFPRIYLTCGMEDSLLQANRSFGEYLKKQGVSITYKECPGGHEWDFWNRSIKDVLDWLPLEGREGSMNSGNIGI